MQLLKISVSSVSSVFSFSGFAEVVEDELHLAGGEDFLCGIVVGLAQGVHERGVDAQPFHESLDSRMGCEFGSVGQGQLGLAHGACAEGFFFLLHLAECFLIVTMSFTTAVLSADCSAKIVVFA